MRFAPALPAGEAVAPHLGPWDWQQRGHGEGGVGPSVSIIFLLLRSLCYLIVSIIFSPGAPLSLFFSELNNPNRNLTLLNECKNQSLCVDSEELCCMTVWSRRGTPAYREMLLLARGSSLCLSTRKKSTCFGFIPFNIWHIF